MTRSLRNNYWCYSWLSNSIGQINKNLDCSSYSKVRVTYKKLMLNVAVIKYNHRIHHGKISDYLIHFDGLWIKLTVTWLTWGKIIGDLCNPVKLYIRRTFISMGWGQHTAHQIVKNCTVVINYGSSTWNLVPFTKKEAICLQLTCFLTLFCQINIRRKD